MHGPTCIFWANLTPFTLEADAEDADAAGRADAAPVGGVVRPKAAMRWRVRVMGGCAGTSAGPGAEPAAGDAELQDAAGARRAGAARNQCAA
jgi:hypothetical protein